MVKITKDIQREMTWCMEFADYIVLVGESLVEVNKRLEQCRIELEVKGLRIIRCTFLEEEMRS